MSTRALRPPILLRVRELTPDFREAQMLMKGRRKRRSEQRGTEERKGSKRHVFEEPLWGELWLPPE